MDQQGSDENLISDRHLNDERNGASAERVNRADSDVRGTDDKDQDDAHAQCAEKAMEYAPKGEKDDLERQAEKEHSDTNKTGSLKHKKISLHALEDPQSVQGDDEDKANEVRWGDSDADDPHQWSLRYRVWLTFLCSLITMSCTFATSAPSPAVSALQQDFGLTTEISQLITATFLFGYVIGPFFWAPGSELIGRRPIFIGTLFASSLFSMADAIAQNRTTLFICRFLAGFFAAAPLSNTGGVIGDIYGPVGIGYAMSVFTACVLIGRSMACTIIVTLMLPETFSPVLLKKRAQRMRRENPAKNRGKWAPAERLDRTPAGILHHTVVKPFYILSLEPILIVITIYLSVVYALLYATFEAFPLVWEDLRGFNSGQTGLIFLGIMIGSCLGALANLVLCAKYKQLVEEWHGQVPPEYRLEAGIAAGPCLIIGLFMFGWAGAYASVPCVPAIATVLLGASICLLFISFLSYIVDVYLMHAASALAANTVIRSALASVFPLFTTQMFQNMGIQWASTLLGCIAVLLAPSPWFFYVYGHRIRQRSKFAPNLDLKMRDQVLRERKKGKGEESV